MSRSLHLSPRRGGPQWRRAFLRWRSWLIVGVVWIAFGIALRCAVDDPSQAVQHELTLGFILVTVIYALETRRMADSAERESDRRLRADMRRLLEVLLTVRPVLNELIRTNRPLIGIPVQGVKTRDRQDALDTASRLRSELSLGVTAVPNALVSSTSDLSNAVGDVFAAYEALVLQYNSLWKQGGSAVPAVPDLESSWKSATIDYFYRPQPTWDLLVNGSLATTPARLAKELRRALEAHFGTRYGEPK